MRNVTRRLMFGAFVWIWMLSAPPSIAMEHEPVKRLSLEDVIPTCPEDDQLCRVIVGMHVIKGLMGLAAYYLAWGPGMALEDDCVANGGEWVEIASSRHPDGFTGTCR